MLSCLCVDERIVLAPNSAQIPPLIAGVKQNVFINPKSQEAAAAAAGGEHGRLRIVVSQLPDK